MLLTTTQKTIDIDLIVSRARSLTERLSSTNADTNETEIAARLEQWCQIVAQGDLEKFTNRLEWSGLDIEKIKPFLADIKEDSSQTLPQWAKTLEQVINLAKNLSHAEIVASQPYLDSKQPIPFEHIYLPCLQVARERLLKRAGNLNKLTDSVIKSLERQLLEQLANLCTSTLMREFNAFRSSGNETKDFILFNILNCHSQEKYYGFIAQLFQDGLGSLFEKYSVLGKLVATTIDLWIDATSEFISRLTKDWVQIEQSFSPKQALKQVTEIKTGLSDPHNGRRSVMILTFDTGMKLVYKPKDLAIEAAFFQFLDWFNQQGQLLPFKVIQVLNYGSHGWVEYVESLPCNNEKEVQGFYQRSGMLLCLIQILEGTDCHYDNLIANGEQPVLIDTETLLHPHNKTPDAIDRSKVQILANKKLTESPLRTLMLPQWGLSANDDLNMDLSGLGGRDEQKELTLKWKNINTDGMNLETELVTVKEGNAPTLNQTPLTPDKYLAHLILGFEQMYRFLSNSKDILLAPNSPLTIFANLKVRYLFRTTRTYDSILHDSFTPELLQSGIDRSIALDVLSRAFLLQEAKPDFWDILEAELQAMEGLDIPFFSVKTSETSLKLSTGVVIPNLFEEPSYQRVITRIKSLSEQDLKEQLEIIRGSFCARFMKQPEMNNSGNQDDLELLSEYTSLTSEQLVQESINIGQELKQWAIDAEDSVTWIGLGLRGDSQSFQLQSLSHNLYDGSSGVALFLAALAKVTGNSDWRDLALKTLHPLRYQLQNMTPQAIKQLKRLGISGATGLGSIVYALVQISDLLDEPDLIVNAKKIASLITLDLIAADRTFNIIGGAAGTILACLKLSEFEPSALGKAIACGEHLLMLVSSQQLNVIADGETGRQGDREIFSVNSSDKLALKIGFAQGLAGIAYALLKLFAVTQDKRFLEGAEKAIAYEQNYVTNIEALAHHNSWASGFAGIALGRLGSLSILDSKAIRKDIISALDITQKHCLEDIDNLAWGNLGRLETLLVASEKLNRPDLLHFGLQATTYLVKQAQARGRFNLVSSSVPFAYNPGFFQGTTGIGYQLLRMAYPQLLPSVLLWN